MIIGECVATLRGHDDEVLDVVFDSTGQYIATASADKTGRVYDALNQLCIATLTGHQAEISKVKFFDICIKKKLFRLILKKL